MDFGLVWAWFGLLVFGFCYNWLVGWLEENDLIEGFRGVLVIFGTAVTLGVAGLFIGWNDFWVTASMFCASGLFMAGGDIQRYLRAKRRGLLFWQKLMERRRRDDS